MDHIGCDKVKENTAKQRVTDDCNYLAIMEGRKLQLSFYNRKDVLMVARDLLGKILVSCFGNKLTAGRIVETEGYRAFNDKASHAFGGRRTPRNNDMYGAPGTAYVYVCYGMHQMMNVVTNAENVPDAVLIRAVEPVYGIEMMCKRTGKCADDKSITSGPGNVGKALGIFKQHSGISLMSDELYMLDDDFSITSKQIGISKRIGVEGAGLPFAKFPYRYYLKGNTYVSGYPKK